MTNKVRVTHVIGPDGERMTRHDLPAPDNGRWVPRRKARVVAVVEGGLISQDEAFHLYDISEEEFSSWQRAFGRLGLKGLCVTRLRQTRLASE
ncbi:DUF1153 domain-containing protein [Limibaculum sp. FT325]|uniref:CtrA inhibitor SciP n=1 Tax=Thermohalobaculum sediminis TaxID=2939436 RepID=UPI0020BF8926|nr:DUF1153 domain-containing protein [Limibaculum sediminis]MCL5775381.1 DUF1153 domain-containing protein [Limibaculum sediminis]